MGKVVYGMSVSLDGFVETPNRSLDWVSVDEVRRLKAEPGLDMDVGGAMLAGSLIRAGLIDEYRLFLQPVILGAGNRFFPPLDERIGLSLLDTRTFGSGVVYLRYARNSN